MKSAGLLIRRLRNLGVMFVREPFGDFRIEASSDDLVAEATELVSEHRAEVAEFLAREPVDGIGDRVEDLAAALALAKETIRTRALGLLLEANNHYSGETRLKSLVALYWRGSGLISSAQVLNCARSPDERKALKAAIERDGPRENCCACGRPSIRSSRQKARCRSCGTESWGNPTVPSVNSSPSPKAEAEADRIDLYRAMPYGDYRRTRHWITCRRLMIRRACFRCQVCSLEGGVDAYHRTLERLGREVAADIAVLCRFCYSKSYEVIREDRVEVRNG